MPIILKIITNAVVKKTIFLLLIEIFPKKEVILDSLSSSIFILLFEKKLQKSREQGESNYKR